MFSIHSYSIGQKLTWLNMLVSGATLLLACSAFATFELADFRTSMVRALSVQAQIIGANSASTLLFNDPDSALTTLSALAVAPDVLSATIYRPSGAVFATWSRDPGVKTLPFGPSLGGKLEAYSFGMSEFVLVRAIEFQGKTIGIVRISTDLRQINDRLIRYASVVVVVLLVSLSAAFMFSSIFQKATARPIEQLAETARIVSREKTYSIRAPMAATADEIGGLIEAFNEMLDQIQKRDTALQLARDELEQRVVRRTAQLEAVNRELESFTYSVAHDLRAPLRHIQGFADALSEDCAAQLDSTARGYLTRIVDSTRRMDHLISDLLGLAQVGRQKLQFRPTALNTLVQEALRDMEQETQRRNIAWHIAELPVVDCDPGLMRLVFNNLLSNAIKYTRPRDTAVIEMGQMSGQDENIIYIRDNGVGFNMKYAHKLFGVFERLHRREDFEGTGVGLATVQRIIHKHGGRIWAEAEVDMGATFFLALPASGHTQALQRREQG